VHSLSTYQQQSSLPGPLGEILLIFINGYSTCNTSRRVTLRSAAREPDLLAVPAQGDQHRELFPQLEQKLATALEAESSKLCVSRPETTPPRHRRGHRPGRARRPWPASSASSPVPFGQRRSGELPGERAPFPALAERVPLEQTLALPLPVFAAARGHRCWAAFGWDGVTFLPSAGRCCGFVLKAALLMQRCFRSR